MFERPEQGEVAILVHMDLADDSNSENLDEFKELVVSAGVEVAEIVTTSRQKPDPKYFIGTGKIQEIAELAKRLKSDLVLFNHTLKPSQERNIEKQLQCRVLDRTTLILDIFAQRARSFEGKLQVELAQLKHLSTRLVRGWTHLERQKGGIGLRGPGETQLETDRRLLALRIKHINKRLDKVEKQREQGRRSRLKAEVPTVSFVGYTNAGKSTLFNVLTGSDVYVQDQLFATLDPTLRKAELSSNLNVILADTVGFIRHLPHDLVNAFRSTLQETAQAHLLLHIIDASEDDKAEKIAEVEEVLKQIHADKIHTIQVMNKIDNVNILPRVDVASDGKIKKIWLSAKTGEGVEKLKQALIDYFQNDIIICEVLLNPADAKLRAMLFDVGAVKDENVDEDGKIRLNICINRRDIQQIAIKMNTSVEKIMPNSRKLLAGAAEAS